MAFRCERCGETKPNNRRAMAENYSQQPICRTCLNTYCELNRHKNKDSQFARLAIRALDWWKYLGNQHREAREMETLLKYRECHLRGQNIVDLMHFLESVEHKLDPEENKNWQKIIGKFDKRNNTDSGSDPLAMRRVDRRWQATGIKSKYG